MPLKYHPSYEKAYAPIRELMNAKLGEPPSPVDELPEIRKDLNEKIAKLQSGTSLAEGVSTDKYRSTAPDGYQVPIVHFYLSENKRTTPGPAILHIHGGGMYLGSPEMMASTVSRHVKATGVPFFSVDYRLAPEAKGDTIINDCYSALLWLHENASKMGVDKSRIGVMGESAGGGLSAGLSILARDLKLDPPLAKQILIYPLLDDTNCGPNDELDELALWHYRDNITAWEAYTGIPREKRTDENVKPYWAPARLKNYHGLPSTYIDVGNLDIFHEENITYAFKLVAANVETELHTYPGVTHAFEAIARGSVFDQRAQENRDRAILDI